MLFEPGIVENAGDGDARLASPLVVWCWKSEVGHERGRWEGF